MKLRTEIENVPLQQPIGCRDGIFVVGSCFADNIGTWLNENCIDVCSNAFGVMYNPASIAQCIKICKDNVLDTQVVKAVDGLYYSFDFHGRFSALTQEELLAQLKQVTTTAAQKLKAARHIVVTFGTAWVYEREQRVVANCHKFSASEFTRRRLSVEEIVDEWSLLLETLSDKHFVFTVSPIRHVKDTLHGNSLSKATLLLAIDELCRNHSNAEYLPVYELLVDDLRDYRFYADDLVHPSAMAVEIVKEYFARNCMDEECRNYLREVSVLVKSAQHRPLHPESEQYKVFKCQNNLKIDQLQEKYHIFGVVKLKV